MEQKIYIMLIGLPFSGKSTWIRKYLAKQPEKNFKVVSSDDIIEEMAAEDGLTYDAAWKKFASDAGKEMNRRFKSYVASGENIIHDQTNLGAKSRVAKLSLVPSSYKKIAVVLSLTDAEWTSRFNQRMAENPGKTIPDFVIKNMARSYVSPTKEEGFDQIIYVRD